MGGGSSYGDPLCPEAPQGATGQNPYPPGTGETPASRGECLLPDIDNPGNHKVPTEKVGTLVLRGEKKNRIGAAKRRARLAEAPTGDSTGGQPPLQGGQIQTQQGPSTSGVQSKGSRKSLWQDPSTSRPNPHEGSQPVQGPGKCQRSSGSKPENGQAKRPRRTGQLSYARAAQEGLQMAVICDVYPTVQVSKDNFVSIQRAIGGLVDGLPEEGFTPRLVDTYWAKGAAMMVCQDEKTRDWLGSEVPKMNAWEGSRLRMMGLEALPTYKRVMAWFPGTAEDTERLFHRLRRLNRGLDTSQWRVYERKEEPSGVRLVLSIDSQSVTVLEGLKWRPFSSIGQAVFSLLCAKPEGKK